MKKIFCAVFILALLLPAIAFGAVAPGTVTISYDSPSDNTLVVTFSCVGSADDGSFPATSTSATTLRGFYITEVRTNPGSTAPQADYDIAINDSDGIDLMGGTLANRSATLSERAVPLLTTGAYGVTPIDGAITLAVTGNNVHSAITVVKVFLLKF